MGSDLKISSTYDDIADVLYLIDRNVKSTHNREVEEGLVLRYDDETDAPAGATIVDYRDHWLRHNEAHLVRRIAVFFSISSTEALRLINSALH